MFYTSAWVFNNDEQEFRNLVPLDFLGKSLKLFNSTINFKIIFLEGYEFLSKEYLNELKGYGFELVDASIQFKNICNRFPSIINFFSHYERNCFLRWIVLKNFIKNEKNITQFWHLDSDIVLYTALDEIAEDTKGKTFMLQGCPAFISISDFRWFDIYEDELLKFEKDIKGYSQSAYNEKKICKLNDYELSNLSMYRNPLVKSF